MTTLASTDSDSNQSSTPPHQPTKTAQSKASADEKYYKNMSRERRLIANARERTRVHTISTAFDALRQAIPTYRYSLIMFDVILIKS